MFVTYGSETTKVFSLDELNDILNRLAEHEHVLRAKGIVNGGETWYYFDLVPGEYEIRTGQADYTGRLCVIGTDLKKEELVKLFEL